MKKISQILDGRRSSKKLTQYLKIRLTIIMKTILVSFLNIVIPTKEKVKIDEDLFSACLKKITKESKQRLNTKRKLEKINFMSKKT